MQDSFDSNPESFQFDIHHFASNLYKEANPTSSYNRQKPMTMPKIEIEERTLTGQSNYE